jgi:hypothetical protein
MSKPQDRSVFKGKYGKWINKRNDKQKATSKHNTQREAEEAARKNLKNQGGGELTTMGKDGKIRSKDTIKPGKDPRNIKDTEM